MRCINSALCPTPPQSTSLCMFFFYLGERRGRCLSYLLLPKVCVVCFKRHAVYIYTHTRTLGKDGGGVCHICYYPLHFWPQFCVGGEGG
jgi:hypothetical protein